MAGGIFVPIFKEVMSWLVKEKAVKKAKVVSSEEVIQQSPFGAGLSVQSTCSATSLN